MAAYHLITQDCAIQITLGGVANGGAPTYATSGTTIFSLLGDLKNLDVGEDLDIVQVAGAGGTRRKVRAKRGGSSITLDKFVLSTGCGFFNCIGQYAKVEFKELSTLSSFKSVEGVITAWKWSGGDDEQTEHIEITCDAEHA